MFGIYIPACRHSCDQCEYFGLYAVFILPLHASAKPGAHKFRKTVGTTSKSQALESLIGSKFRTGDPRNIGRHRTKFNRHGDLATVICTRMPSVFAKTDFYVRHI